MRNSEKENRFSRWCQCLKEIQKGSVTFTSSILIDQTKKCATRSPCERGPQHAKRSNSHPERDRGPGTWHRHRRYGPGLSRRLERKGHRRGIHHHLGLVPLR